VVLCEYLFLKWDIYGFLMLIDDTDRRILRYMMAAPSIVVAELAERAGVTAATCWRRIERLKDRGVLKGEEAVLNWQALGFEVEVSLRFSLDKTNPRAFDEFIDAARNVPEVIEIQTFLGRTDLRLNIVARDMAHYQEIYRRRILTLPHINDTEALMLVSTIKNSADLPL
jgi:Lrp/AsnC family transcriptional regulator